MIQRKNEEIKCDPHITLCKIHILFSANYLQTVAFNLFLTFKSSFNIIKNYEAMKPARNMRDKQIWF